MQPSDRALACEQCVFCSIQGNLGAGGGGNTGHLDLFQQI